MTEVDLLGTHDVLKGRRFGNLVLVARRHGVVAGPELARAVARGTLRAGTRRPGPAAYGKGFSDTDAEPSPPPPDLGRWRLR